MLYMCESTMYDVDMTKDTNLHTAHCSSCGSTDYEDLNTGDQGYTACCNKRVCYGNQGTYATGPCCPFARDLND
jgi:hypothetical protein